jgi:hypothetical protein
MLCVNKKKNLIGLNNNNSSKYGMKSSKYGMKWLSHAPSICCGIMQAWSLYTYVVRNGPVTRGIRTSISNVFLSRTPRVRCTYLGAVHVSGRQLRKHGWVVITWIRSRSLINVLACSIGIDDIVVCLLSYITTFVQRRKVIPLLSVVRSMAN